MTKIEYIEKYHPSDKYKISSHNLLAWTRPEIISKKDREFASKSLIISTWLYKSHVGLANGKSNLLMLSCECWTMGNFHFKWVQDSNFMPRQVYFMSCTSSCKASLTASLEPTNWNWDPTSSIAGSLTTEPKHIATTEVGLSLCLNSYEIADIPIVAASIHCLLYQPSNEFAKFKAATFIETLR